MSSFKYSTPSYREYPVTADKSPRSLILSRPQFKSDAGRIRQIILSNKKSINNAVDSLKTSNQDHSTETFSSSFYKMPLIENKNASESMLVKTPFKQSKPSTVNSAKTASTLNYPSLKPIHASATFTNYQNKIINLNLFF